MWIYLFITTNDNYNGDESVTINQIHCPDNNTKVKSKSFAFCDLLCGPSLTTLNGCFWCSHPGFPDWCSLHIDVFIKAGNASVKQKWPPANLQATWCQSCFPSGVSFFDSNVSKVEKRRRQSLVNDIHHENILTRLSLNMYFMPHCTFQCFCCAFLLDILVWPAPEANRHWWHC